MSFSNALRICWVIDRLELAGGPRFFEHLAAGLDPAQFRCSVATAPDSPLREVFVKNGIEVVPIAFSAPFDPRALAALFRLFRDSSFDIVHGMGLRADFHARLAARLAGGRVKVVSTVAMSAAGFDVSWWRRGLYRIAEGWSERWVDAFITDSNYVRRQLVREHGIADSRVRTVYIGADVNAFDPPKADKTRLRRELGLGSGPLIGSLGRLVAQKGHDYFLEAAAIASRVIPDLQALVVGDGALRRELERRAVDLGIGGRVRFLGARRDFADLLSALDVLVIASRLESIPVLLFEAMAMERPIIATRVGGISEIVESGEHAVLVSPGNPQEIAMAVSALLRGAQSARDMGKRARERVAAKFQVRHCVESVAECYRGVMNDYGGEP